MGYIFKLALAVAILTGASKVQTLSQELSAEEFVQQLRPVSKTRSLTPNRGIAIEGSERQATDSSVNLYINFEYDSAKLKQDALITLDQLAKALSDERLIRLDFLVGGHTDAAGSDEYNARLSQRRAHSVKEYLTQHHGISADRLVDIGFGEKRLLDSSSPLDGINRRVQIVTLVSSSQ